MEKPGFPLPAQDLVPHRPPMLLIDQLVEGGDGGGTAEAVISSDHLFLDGDRLHDAALLEVMAQAFAAVKGLEDRRQGKTPAMGFLVGAKRMRWYLPAWVGDRLTVRIKKVGETEGFTLAEGKVERRGELLAEGTIMVYVPMERR